MSAAAILVGRRAGWLKPDDPYDFFDVKEIARELLRALGVEAPVYVPATQAKTTAKPSALLHPGVSAEIRAGGSEGHPSGDTIGQIGEIHPRLRHTLGLEAPAFYLEVALSAVAGERRAVRSVTPPRFPASSRDVSFWIDERVTAAEQRALLGASAEPLLRELRVLEDYRDPRYAPAGKKGMLWTLVYRADDRTLTDAEVDTAHAKIVSALQAAPSVVLR
jgi:phenylalanyl-tRNA synthetase beta chain